MILCVITITVMIEMVEVSSSLNLMSLLLCFSDLGPSMLRGGFEEVPGASRRVFGTVQSPVQEVGSKGIYQEAK